jgi:hypothetical protein
LKGALAATSVGTLKVYAEKRQRQAYESKLCKHVCMLKVAGAMPLDVADPFFQNQTFWTAPAVANYFNVTFLLVRSVEGMTCK